MAGFTQDELDAAKTADLCLVAENMGYHVKKAGRCHTLSEMDSVRIYDRRTWYRFSGKDENGKAGGTQIDFLMAFAGMDVKESVEWLLDFIGYRRDNNKMQNNNRLALPGLSKKNIPERKPFILPRKSSDNLRVIQYLTKERCISYRVVKHFIDKNMLYESAKYHNIVFVGTDVNGEPKFASMRGIKDKDGKVFKGDVSGNDKRYGFHEVEQGSSTVSVFESAIDLMSYMDLYQPIHENMIALGMVADNPLEQFLEDYPHIEEVKFFLDRDEAGIRASEQLAAKYYERGYSVQVNFPPEPYKDMNEWLQGICRKHTRKEPDRELKGEKVR